MSKLYRKGCEIWIDETFKYPIWKDKYLIATFTFESEAIRFFEVLQRVESELLLLLHGFLDIKPGMERAKPLKNYERLLDKVQKECCIKDS